MTIMQYIILNNFRAWFIQARACNRHACCKLRYSFAKLAIIAQAINWWSSRMLPTSDHRAYCQLLIIAHAADCWSSRMLQTVSIPRISMYETVQKQFSTITKIIMLRWWHSARKRFCWWLRRRVAFANICTFATIYANDVSAHIRSAYCMHTLSRWYSWCLCECCQLRICSRR